MTDGKEDSTDGRSEQEPSQKGNAGLGSKPLSAQTKPLPASDGPEGGDTIGGTGEKFAATGSRSMTVPRQPVFSLAASDRTVAFIVADLGGTVTQGASKGLR
jgi:hypothetical protein